MTYAKALTAMWPIKSDGDDHWLVPGEWTRGRALGWVAMTSGIPFVKLRARRAWMRWHHLASTLDVAGWAYPDGVLAACERSESDAEPYWEVTRA